MLNIVPCQSCAGPTVFTTELQAHGPEPGHHIYFCETCRRYTWVTGRAARRQQQQQQPQPKTD